MKDQIAWVKECTAKAIDDLLQGRQRVDFKLDTTVVELTAYWAGPVLRMDIKGLVKYA